MLNKVTLIGRLGRDPEVRFTQQGTAVCNFTVATDETWKDQAGQKQKRTEWHQIVVWRQLAEICGKYLVKGKLVYLEGKLQTRTWEDKEGQKRYKTEIQANEMKMLGGQGNGGQGQQEPSAPQEPVARQEPSDDDIPF